MTLLPEVERALLEGVRREQERRRARRWLRLRAPIAAFAALLGTTTAALAASGVILSGAPVAIHGRQSPTAGFGVPAPGQGRLLPLRAADPEGGLPWGMRVVHTTRGYVCVQVGRVDHGVLGELGIDGAFHDDGRFHPLPVNASPESVSQAQRFDIDCEAGAHTTFAGGMVGIESSAASNPPSDVGRLSTRRKISYGLLGPHAQSVAYRSGSEIRHASVLAGLGAYLIVQQANSSSGLGGLSDTMGNAETPASPNGALTAITYRYGSKTCTDTGHGDVLRACGLSEGPPPKPAPLPPAYPQLRAELTVSHHTVIGAQIVFHAPYPVRSASERYFASARSCADASGVSNEDAAKGKVIRINVTSMLADACARSTRFEVTYTRELNGVPAITSIGKVTVQIPHDDRTPRPAPRRFRDWVQRMHRKRLSKAR